MQCACAVLYWHLWPVWLFHVLTHYFINGMISRNKMYILICSTRFNCNIPHSNKNSARCVKNVHIYRSSCKNNRYSCQILMRLDFFSIDFRQILNIKFHEISCSRSRVVPCGRKDGQTWRNYWSLFAVLRGRAPVYKTNYDVLTTVPIKLLIRNGKLHPCTGTEALYRP